MARLNEFFFMHKKSILIGLGVILLVAAVAVGIYLAADEVVDPDPDKINGEDKEPDEKDKDDPDDPDEPDDPDDPDEPDDPVPPPSPDPKPSPDPAPKPDPKDPEEPDEPTYTSYLEYYDEVYGYAAVASAHPDSTQAGIDVLLRGGNAFDAAVAVGLALTVVEPNMSGLGGSGVGVYHMGDGSEAGSIGFYTRAPMNVQPYFDGTADRRVGMTSAGVPGVLKGLQSLQERFGNLTFAEAAADLPELAWGWFNLELEETFQTLVDEGPDSFYKGSFAEKFAEELQARGSLITLEDLARYDVYWTDAIRTTYRGYDVYAGGFPSAGISVVQMLNTLENFDVSSMELGGAERYHLMAEVIKQATVDRGAHYADPTQFDYNHSLGLATKSYGKLVADNIDMEKSSTRQTRVSPQIVSLYSGNYPYAHSVTTGTELRETLGLSSRNSSFSNKSSILLASHSSDVYCEEDSIDTTAYSIVDLEGNMVMIQQTLGVSRGSGEKMFGFYLNNNIRNLFTSPGSVNLLEPGVMSRSTIAPTIVARDGRPVASTGTPGGGYIPGGVTQVISNLIDYGLSPKEAADFPQMNATDLGTHIHIENRACPDALDKLRDMGHTLRITTEPRIRSFGGFATTRIDWEKGFVEAYGDFRRDGFCAAAVIKE